MSIAILPMLQVGGMQLFQMESSDKSEKILPRAFELTMATALVYLLLIIACVLVYVFLGMSVFDAVCHALPTLATGGFSTHDASFGHFTSPALIWAGTIFMAFGAMPFVVFIKAMRGEPLDLWRDKQVRAFVVFLVTVSMILALWLTLTRDIGFLAALRAAAFNVTSIVTTTGFASEDYTKWGPFAIGVLGSVEPMTA